MLLQGTHDEITYFNLMCQKLNDCSGCPLKKWCRRRLPEKDGDTVSHLVIKDTGKKCGSGYKTVLIGGNDNQESR